MNGNSRGFWHWYFSAQGRKSVWVGALQKILGASLLIAVLALWIYYAFSWVPEDHAALAQKFLTNPFVLLGYVCIFSYHIQLFYLAYSIEMASGARIPASVRRMNQIVREYRRLHGRNFPYWLFHLLPFIAVLLGAVGFLSAIMAHGYEGRLGSY